MIASLGMYDRFETAPATDRFWTEIRNNLRKSRIAAPDRLNRDTPYWETWQDPGLVFSQTCGRPYRLALHTKAQLVGTPDFGLPDTDPGYYYSVFLVRKKDRRISLADFADTCFAFNEDMSQSGWAAPQCHVAAKGFQFTNTWQSGGHVASAKAVAGRRADITAIDAMTWELIKRYESFSLGLRVLAKTEPTPGLPYITGLNVDREVVARSVQTAIETLDLADRQVLRLKGLVQIRPDAYLAVPNP